MLSENANDMDVIGDPFTPRTQYIYTKGLHQFPLPESTKHVLQRCCPKFPPVKP